MHAPILGSLSPSSIQKNHPQRCRSVIRSFHGQKIGSNAFFKRGREETRTPIIFPRSEEVLEVIVEPAATTAHAPILSALGVSVSLRFRFTVRFWVTWCSRLSGNSPPGNISAVACTSGYFCDRSPVFRSTLRRVSRPLANTTACRV